MDRLAALLADPALPGMDAGHFAPFFRGVIDLPPDLARCKDVAGYTPRATPFAMAVAATLAPAAAPCPDRHFGRLGFAMDNRSDADTNYLITALTARLGKPLTENVWFPKAGGQTVSAVRESWQVGDAINVVVLLEPDEAGGLVGVSVVHGTGPQAAPLQPKEPPPAPDSIQAMINRFFQ